MSASSIEIKRPLVTERVHRIPFALAKQKKVLPLEEDEKSITVALCDPLNFEAIEEIRCLTGKKVIIELVTEETLEEFIGECYHQKEGVASELIAEFSEFLTEKGVEDYELLGDEEESPAVKLLNRILIEAIQQGASDVHFEPQEMGLKIRYRLDGVLQERHAPPKELQLQLITRLKVLAKLDIAEQRLPQDGRIKLSLGGKAIDFRVSTIPVAYGERVVLRILDRAAVVLGLEKLGMTKNMLTTLEMLIHLTEGILLVTGPTGSGKTTTLYTLLSEINSSETNIMTIEDPVEYKLQGMAQIGVNPKISLTFAAGLRHILRQDPDVIMVGEIRDLETAEIAIQASLTGHMVFSTLHTNDAPSAITRLTEMGIEPYLLSSSIVGVIAQRLVRTICPHCKKKRAPSQEEKSLLGYIDEVCEGVGCAECYGTGYQGRRGIYELMPLTSSLKKEMAKQVDSSILRTIALEEGMESLKEFGLHLVRGGETTVKEVLRVAR